MSRQKELQKKEKKKDNSTVKLQGYPAGSTTFWVTLLKSEQSGSNRVTEWRLGQSVKSSCSLQKGTWKTQTVFREVKVKSLGCNMKHRVNQKLVKLVTSLPESRPGSSVMTASCVCGAFRCGGTHRQPMNLTGWWTTLYQDSDVETPVTDSGVQTTSFILQSRKWFRFKSALDTFTSDVTCVSLCLRAFLWFMLLMRNQSHGA